MANYIQDRHGALWSRRQGKGIAKEVWVDWGLLAIRNEFSYPTFVGCNRVALRLARKGFLPKQWGAIEREVYAALDD
jgi:hypothetical protein